MPYAISGYAGGTLREVVLHDDGTVTGDGLVTGWLADNPPPATDVETVTLHIGKLLTEAHATPMPAAAAAPAPTPTPEAAVASPHAPYTSAELEALTVTDLRELATEAQIAGAQRMTKAELVAALLASQGS